MVGKKPVAKIKGGNNVSVALWENQIQVKGKTVTILKATLQRRYKDKNGDWQTANSFGKSDIPDAIYCLQRAFGKIIEMQIDSANGDGVVEEAIM